MNFKFSTLLVLMFVIPGANAQERLFNFNSIYTAPASEVITKATKLKLDRSVLVGLYTRQDETVRIELPLENTIVILNLKKANLFAKNFRLVESNTLSEVAFVPGYHLQGTIEGETKSLVALSIFEDFTGGIVSYRGSNYNIAVANNRNDHSTDDYVIYSDRDYHAPMPTCDTEEEETLPIVFDRDIPRTTFVGCPVDMYYETGYKMFQNLMGIQPVMNYLTLLFNCKQILYNNEDIQMQLREVLVWNTAEPEYPFTNTADALTSFRSRIGASGFNGDLAHYVTFTTLGGGRAALDGLCNPGDGGKCAVSGNLRANYAAFPNYSFTVMVLAHETGHNIGSRHTHNCSWPGGAIDNCYATEGGCPQGPQPPNGGTIMSYCHTVSTGVNFANGFGPLPGDLIRSKVLAASNAGCICDCNSIEMDVTKQDIGCGNPTGSATAVVTGGTGPFTYLWSNGSTGSSVSGLPTGTYYVTATGSTPNCTVVKGFKILSSGNATTVALSPTATSVTNCPNDSYTLSASVSPSGSYTYQWHNDAGPIAGANSTSYTVSSPVASTGTYYMTASSSACTGQSPSVTVNFQPVPVPVISPAGPLNVCDGQSVTLSSSSSNLQKQWLRNGVVIPGAAGSNFNTTQAGSYTVRHYSTSNAGCTEVSLPVVISIKPKPVAVISPATIRFCEGGQGTISHTPVPGETYTWYRNSVPVTGQTSPTLSVNSSGNYSLKVTGINGCENTSEATIVTEDPLPAVGLSPANSVLLCDGGTLTIQAPSLIAGIYTWYNGSEQLSNSLNQLNVSASGIYSVHILNSVTGCENASVPTNVTITPPPSIFAGNDTIIATGQPIRLHAVATSSTAVERFEWSPVTGLDNPFSASPVARLSNDQEYTVKGIYPSGCIATDKISIRVLKGPAIYVPSAFTPNGDGLNDVLKCTAIGLRSFAYLAVYNRLGQKVFHSSDLQRGWDGKWKGVPVETSSFVFIAEGIDYAGRNIVSKGTVTVIR